MKERTILDRNSRLGIQLFLLYTAFYLAFVLVNAFAPEWGEWDVVGGLNLAVLWGFALIAFAFLLATIYGVFCTGEDESKSDDMHNSETKR